MLRLFTIVTISIVSSASSVSVQQTDWSEGSGFPASVTEWQSNFAESSSISWRAIEGQVSLASTVLTAPEETVISANYPCSSLGYGDLDRDGDMDLIATSSNTHHMTIFWNNGSEGWSPEPMPGLFEGALWVDVCDLDADGDSDLLEVTQTLDCAVVWLNADGIGGQWEECILDPDFIIGHSIFGRDIDGDGLMDITAASLYGDEVRIWYNNGGYPDTWDHEIVSTTAPGIRTALPADLDGDGTMEIVGAIFDSGRMVWWEKSGSDWVEHTISDNFSGAHHTFCSDLDFDGDLDVLGTSFYSGKLTWWRNDGGSPIAWHRTDITSSLSGALNSWAGDIDGDGDMDVAATAWTADKVMWYENLDGIGNSWENHEAAAGFNGAWPVVITDTDGDGCL
ncbi:MAG: VCBS repeat-containing protein, partial [Candidatus Fermentibacteria bacterium]